MTLSFSRIACALVAVCCIASPLWAQQTGRPDRPYRGLFGGGAAEWEQSLAASASLGVGLDNNILAVSGVASDLQDLQLAGANGRSQIQRYGYMSAGLSYSLSKTRVGFGASLGTSGQYVPSLASPYVSSHSGGLGVSVQLSRRSRLSANHSVSLQPYNVLVLGLPLGEPVLGQFALIEPTFGISRQDHISQVSDVGFSRQIGRRASLGLSYGRMRTGASTSFGGSALTSQMGSGRFSMGLTKGLGAHFGYAYTEGRMPGEPSPVVGHNIDAGLDFTRTLGLSISRRTRVSFNTGSGVLRDRQQTYFRLTGSAVLTHEIARSWAASLSYNRGMGFVERFRQPFFTDSVMLGLDGLIARRLNFRSAAGAVSGDVGLASNANTFASYFGSTGLTMGLTRSLAIGTDYNYYRYGFAQAEGLPTGIARQMGRHSARVYLSVWVPILQRGRRTDASR
jgi:hypothetical protein